ncbi:MAG TPA: LLM class F420-dependent oxidoreductase [Longimicrobiales bacterium]
MDLRIFIEPQQGASYERVLTLARVAERLGFDGFFSSDHYLKMSDVSGLPGPLDTWTTLAGLARDTSRLRLGPLVTPVTFRQPGPLAIAVAQADAMSAGRIELALGAGWYEAEHDAYGIPFPPTATRFEMLTEQLEIITGLWSTPIGEQFNYRGKHYRFENCPALPKPQQQPRPPIILGGHGAKRTPQLAATYADEFNQPFPPLDAFKAQRDRVRAACEAAQRDPASMKFSVALVLCCGANEAEVARRAAAIGREVDELRRNGAAGTPAEVVDKLRAYRDAGAERVYLQTLDIDDTAHLELVAAEVAPHL